jgi:hypothetical protein
MVRRPQIANRFSCRAEPVSAADNGGELSRFGLGPLHGQFGGAARSRSGRCCIVGLVRTAIRGPCTVCWLWRVRERGGDALRRW